MIVIGKNVNFNCKAHKPEESCMALAGQTVKN
jgi:hypothetical protein